MTYVLDLPDQPFCTPNSRTHWAVRARCARDWRDTTAWLAKAKRIPPQDRIVVALTMQAKDRRRRDRDNLVSGVLKHCIDGLVDAGVVPDDSPEYVDARMPRIVTCPERSSHGWVLTVAPSDAEVEW